jgi:hypothetical protein
MESAIPETVRVSSMIVSSHHHHPRLSFLRWPALAAIEDRVVLVSELAMKDSVRDWYRLYQQRVLLSKNFRTFVRFKSLLCCC